MLVKFSEFCYELGAFDIPLLYLTSIFESVHSFIPPLFSRLGLFLPDNDTSIRTS